MTMQPQPSQPTPDSDAHEPVRDGRSQAGKEELEALLAEESYSAIGRQFDVADTTVKKWARMFGRVP